MSFALLDKAGVRRSFAAAADSYDSAATLQRRVAVSLLQKFPLQTLDGRILDLGCGTGFLTRQFMTDYVDQSVIALDIALPMLRTARRKTQDLPVDYLCADAEKLPFADNSLQQIYSNLALQWCQDLSAVLTDMRRLLRPGGQLVFSTFGPATLRELKAAWAAVDDFAHVNDFYSLEQIRGFLKVAGWEAVTVESVVYQLRYSSVPTLMRELKDLGAHNVNQTRNRRLTTRSQLQHMVLNYEAAMADDEIIASYEIILVRGRR